MWTLPRHEVARIAERLSGDDVIDARSSAERIAAYPGAEVIVANRMNAAEFDAARDARWIHATAVGVGGLMIQPVVESDVIVTNTKGVHSDAIAEHALALALAVRRGLHIAGVRQAARDWAQLEFADRRVKLLAASHMLVVGLGAIGSRVATLAHGLGMRVTGVRRHPNEPRPAGVSEVFGPDRLRDALAEADVVVLAVPRTDQTRAMFGAEEFAAMKPTAVLVNVARGRLIDEDALVAALERGQFAGAGLDAFEAEPLPVDHPLWQLPNVLITPHVAAFADDYWAPAVDLFLENVARYKRSEPLINIVHKGRGY
jgi:D-2-hydroxyacid dehydrogenase (NADP+)